MAFAIGALVAPHSASAVASQKPVTAILQGASQNGWITDTQLRAEYTKWAGYPNVVPALRSLSSNKDEAKMVGWQSAGLKYFYTAVSSDYRFSGSMYAPAASPDAVMARTNNLGLYYHQLLTQLAADNGWVWQTALSKVNWAQLDQWATAAKARGKKIVWVEPSHAFDEVKKNASAMAYFTKWKDTVVTSYGTNFPDQVDAWARPGSLAVANAAGSLKGASVQAFNMRDRSVAVTRTAVAALAKDALDSGSTYIEFSGTSADLQPGSEFLLGAQSFLSAAIPPPTAPRPEAQPFTAILSGMSGADHRWTTEVQDRETYDQWDAKPQVKAAFRGMSYNPDDPTMLRWESFGYRYYWTVASSDHEQDSGGTRGVYVQADGPSRVLARSNNQGLYMHEVISREAAKRAQPLWNWESALELVNWGLIDRWVKEARARGKSIIWSEPSHAWVALLNNKSAMGWMRSWSDVLTISYSTNFSDQVNSWAKPGAVDLASALNAPLGESVQSFYFHDACNGTPSMPGVPAYPTVAGTSQLATEGYNAGASVFEVQGCQADMQPSSPYIQGVGSFLSTLADKSAPRDIVRSSAVKVPLYASYSPGAKDQRLTRSGAAGAGYWYPTIAAYVYNTQAPGTTPLYELYSSVNDDYAYVANATTNDGGVIKTERQAYKDSWLQYRDTGANGAANIVGYVYTEKYADTAPLYRAWNSGEGDHAYFSSRWLYDKHGQQGWEGQGSVGFVFTTDGRAQQVPLLRARNLASVDHFYTTFQAEADQWASQYGYTADRGSIGRIWTQPIDGAVPLYQLYSGIGTDYEHTSDPFQARADNTGWLGYSTPRVIGYVKRAWSSDSPTQLDELFNPGSSNDYNSIDHALVTTLGDRDALLGQGYRYAEVEGFVGAPPYPISQQYGGTDGINQLTEAKTFYKAFFNARDDEQNRMLNGLSPVDRLFVKKRLMLVYRIGVSVTDANVPTGEDQDENEVPIATAAAAGGERCRSAHDGKDPKRYVKRVQEEGGELEEIAKIEFKIGFCATSTSARINKRHPIHLVRADMINGFGKMGWQIWFGDSATEVTSTENRAAKNVDGIAYFRQNFQVRWCGERSSSVETSVSWSTDIGPTSGGVGATRSKGLTTSGCDTMGEYMYEIKGLPIPPNHSNGFAKAYLNNTWTSNEVPSKD